MKASTAKTRAKGAWLESGLEFGIRHLAGYAPFRLLACAKSFGDAEAMLKRPNPKFAVSD
jgi:hypothetical protein